MPCGLARGFASLDHSRFAFIGRRCWILELRLRGLSSALTAPPPVAASDLLNITRESERVTDFDRRGNGSPLRSSSAKGPPLRFMYRPSGTSSIAQSRHPPDSCDTSGRFPCAVGVNPAIFVPWRRNLYVYSRIAASLPQRPRSSSHHTPRWRNWGHTDLIHSKSRGLNPPHGCENRAESPGNLHTQHGRVSQTEIAGMINSMRQSQEPRAFVRCDAGFRRKGRIYRIHDWPR